MTGAAGCAARGASSEAPAFVIEKPAILLPRQPAPPYPSELRATGDTGTVRIRVAVDPSGRADSASVEVLASPHPAFTRAVLAMLPHYRFLPAETGGGPPRDCRVTAEGVRTCRPGRPGRKVRSVVEIPFVFVPRTGDPTGGSEPPG